MTDSFVCPRRSILTPDHDHWRPDRTCSYCGSLDPAVLFELLDRPDHRLVPTDRTYKYYVRTPSSGQRKGYFQHLSRIDQARFVELVNAGRVNFAHPGRFYVLPYFVQVKT